MKYFPSKKNLDNTNYDATVNSKTYLKITQSINVIQAKRLNIGFSHYEVFS